MKSYLANNNIKLFSRHSERENLRLWKDYIQPSRGSCFGNLQRKTQEGILISFETFHQNTMHLSTEVSKWLLKMLAKTKKLNSG